jgi:hypothetical protein
MGVSEDQINSKLDSIELNKTLTLKSKFLEFLFLTPFGFILSFIIALIMRKKRPVFE